MTMNKFAALKLIVSKLVAIGRSTCERTGCPPDRMANAFVIAGLTHIVGQVGNERTATWLRGIADEVEADDDLTSTVQ